MFRFKQQQKKELFTPKTDQRCLHGRLFLTLVFYSSGLQVDWCLRWNAPVSKWITWKKGLQFWQAWLDLYERRHLPPFCIPSYVWKWQHYLQQGISDCGEMELQGLTQIMDISGDVDRLGRGRFQHAEWEHKNFLHAELVHLWQFTCWSDCFGGSSFDFPLYLSAVCKPTTLQLLRALYSTMAYFKDDSIMNCSKGAIWLLRWLL